MSLQNDLYLLNAYFNKRIHKSSIVNLSQVKELKPKQNGDYEVTLKNGRELRLSRNYNQCLEQLLRE